MAGFPLCSDCRAEYANPMDRRFHAQTMACPACGPRLALWDADGRSLAETEAALGLAVAALRQGRIVALKGVGGFQLLADAANPAAVAELRLRKHRPGKPFALLADWPMAQRLCQVSPAEAALLQEPAAPIVLLQRNGESAELAPAVAPGLPWLGLILPASPLHHLLLADFGRPLVATSGNRSSEPICIEENDALQRLAGIADVFLVHDRPIRRPLDDSVLRYAAGRPLTLRRARGYAPSPIELPESLPPILAAGGHLKNTVAVSLGRQAVLSQHLGDLDDALTQRHCAATLEELPRLFGVAPRALACDSHPDYASRRLAESRGLPLHPVSHHYAHALACMAEHRLRPPLLAITWDGIGLGEDGGLWGGEFLRIEPGGYRRYASLLPLRLPGGEKAVKEPRRVALAAIHAAGWPAIPPALRAAFSDGELATLQTMLERGLNAPECSSAGRLFDAVAALLGLCQVNAFEGQAAMLLETAASRLPGSSTVAAVAEGSPALPFALQQDPDGLLRCDWRPWLQALLTAAPDSQKLVEHWAYAFHAALAETALAVTQRQGLETVVLCGGCFQNRLLLELCSQRLCQAGFAVYWPQAVPPNDGGLALGQLLACAG
jgi:hydrogenase maturation protein HypF